MIIMIDEAQCIHSAYFANLLIKRLHMRQREIYSSLSVDALTAA